MKKRQIIITISILVSLLIIGFGAYTILGRDSDTSNTDKEIKEKFDCDRVTADARATDMYCRNPELYRQQLQQDKDLNPSDSIR